MVENIKGGRVDKNIESLLILIDIKDKQISELEKQIKDLRISVMNYEKGQIRQVKLPKW